MARDDLPEIPEAIDITMRSAARRTWKHLARERIDDMKPTIPLGKKFFAVSGREAQQVEKLFASEECRALAHQTQVA